MGYEQTKYWVVDKNKPSELSYPQIEAAAALLMEGEVVAFPTETVYGLGANALSREAVDKIFKAKGRPSDNPLIVHIAEKSQLNELVREIPDVAKKLIDRFWPGPLTLVLKKAEGIAENVTAGLDTVAVRMPDHPVALAIIAAAGLPIAAPSANVSGRPSPTTAQHVKEDLDGRIAGIIDGGATGVGVESTVLDCTEAVPMILRPGGITKEQLEQVIGQVQADPALLVDNQAPKSPGMKYTHYAPKAPLTIVEGSIDAIQSLVNEARRSGKKVGIMTTEEAKTGYEADVVVACGVRSDLATVARDLYGALREFDEHELDVIYAEAFPDTEVGAAIMNRLRKAAGQRVIRL